MSKATPNLFERAQQAELENWARYTGDDGRISYELEEHAEVLREMDRLLSPDRYFSRSLEVGVGCFGLGLVACHLEGQVGQVDGLDPLPLLALEPRDPVLSARVERIGNQVRYIRGRGEELPFASDTYDLVACINVVDHAEHPEQILEEIGRVLRPGGVLVFSVSTLSFVGGLKWRLRRRFRPDDWIYQAHLDTFSWPRANRLVKRAADRVLWDNRPGTLQRLVGRGRMSSWILERV